MPGGPAVANISQPGAGMSRRCPRRRISGCSTAWHPMGSVSKSWMSTPGRVADAGFVRSGPVLVGISRSRVKFAENSTVFPGCPTRGGLLSVDCLAQQADTNCMVENMTTASGDQEGTAPSVPSALKDVLPKCKRCQLSYVLNKSTSALRLTYCSFLCELGDLGFSMAGLESMERAPVEETPPEAEPEPVAIP